MEECYYMSLALEEARLAAAEGEIPVGAVVVKDGEVIARAHNRRQEDENPTGHAEVLALCEAAAKLKTRRLTGCTLYVTLEPCPMCAGALINSMIDRVVFGAYDKKAGALGSVCNLFAMPFPHISTLSGGVMESECAKLLTEFFRGKRQDR